MTTLAILPRGGLGDVLYHALFARYVRSNLPGTLPLLLAPPYAAFLATLLDVNHIPVCSVLTDASAGLRIRSEIAFCGEFYKLRGACLASFTNDVIDNGLARLFGLSLFDKGTLGNSIFPLRDGARLISRGGLNYLLGYHRNIRLNPKHIVDRQRHALIQSGIRPNLPGAYREIWSGTVAPLQQGPTESRLLLLFPETAQLERNLTFKQVDLLVSRLRSEYQIRIFTRYPDHYQRLGVETVGFSDRLEPIRQIRRAAAVISADTFSAHLAGINGTPTYVICNFAYRPIWCQYWGCPFANVFNFEAGGAYQLDDDFGAFTSSEDTLLFRTALEASEQITGFEPNLTSAGVLTGSAARS